MYLIRAGAIENIEWLIRKTGLNPNEVLAEANLSSALLREPETLISYQTLADFLDYCAVLCDDSLFGFHLTQIQSPLVLGELASLLAQQRTIRAAFDFAEQYIYLHAKGVHLQTVLLEDRVEIQLAFDFSNNSGLKQLVQLSVGQQFEYAIAMAPDQKQNIKMHLTQSIDQKDLEALNHYKENVISGSHFDGISCPISWLDIELVRNNIALDQYVQNRIAAMNERYPNDLPSQVRYLCSNLMASGECTIKSVSHALGTQPRTLQRKLKKQGLNFRILLQKVRQLRAEQYLRDSRMNVTDIALNVGYSETAVFSRNFKMWTGLSPLAWRDKFGNVATSR